MGRFFDMDSPIMRVLNTLADLMILNLIVLFFVVVPFTGGASLTGMHYVLLKMVRGEDTYTIKGFWKSFKQNFKQSTILWIIVSAIVIILAIDFYWIYLNAAIIPRIYVYVMFGLAIILYMFFLWIFPLQSRFDNPIKNTLKNSVLFAILGLPRTVGMVLISLLPIILLYFFDIQIVPILILFGFTAPAYLMAMLYNGMFKKFEPEEEKVDGDGEILTDDDDEELQAAIKRMQDARDNK